MIQHKNLARFALNAAPSSDAEGNRGFVAVAAQSVILTLESPADVASAVVHLPDAAFPYGPKASPVCPSVVWVESGTTVYALPSPVSSAEFIAPAGVNSFVVRVVATLTDGRVQAFDREVAVLGLSTGLRKPIPRESNEFAVRGPLDVVAKLAGLVETGGGGPPLSDADPLADAVAADPGTSLDASRADHVHPEAASTSALSRIVVVDPGVPATADSFQTWADLWTAIGTGADAREIILRNSGGDIDVPAGNYSFQRTRSVRGAVLGAFGQLLIWKFDAGAVLQNLNTIGGGLLIRGSADVNPVMEIPNAGSDQTLTIGDGTRIFAFLNPGPFILVRPQVSVVKLQLGSRCEVSSIAGVKPIIVDPAAALTVELLGAASKLGSGAISIGVGSTLTVNCLGPDANIEVNAITAPAGSTVRIRASRIAKRTALTNNQGGVLGTLIYELVDDTVEDGVTASIFQTQGNGPINADVTEVATVANANDNVTLALGTPGRAQTVINHGANILQLFPAGGDDLGFGVNVSTTQAPGVTNRYLCYKAGFLEKL